MSVGWLPNSTHVTRKPLHSCNFEDEERAALLALVAGPMVRLKLPPQRHLSLSHSSFETCV